MAVKFAKEVEKTKEAPAKAKAPEKTVQVFEQEEVKVVDEMGKAQEELAALMANPKIKELNDIISKNSARLKEIADEKFKDDEEGMITGQVYAATVGKKGNNSSVPEENYPKIMKIIGKDTWVKITKPGITDLRKYLNQPQQEELIKMERTGSRTVKVNKLGK